jgi:hypothetical protein
MVEATVHVVLVWGCPLATKGGTMKKRSVVTVLVLALLLVLVTASSAIAYTNEAPIPHSRRHNRHG